MKNPINSLTKIIANIDTKRSEHWPFVRREWLKNNPCCAACGSKDDIEVHHIKPFHLFPELELDSSNFITLCESIGKSHHLKIGHSFEGKTSWKVNNPNVVDTAENILLGLTVQ